MGIEQTLNHQSGANSLPEVTLTTRKCSTCGTTAPDEASVFCNRCGAQLPAEDILTCRKCGKTSTDLQSRYCDRCGSPLAPATQPASPAIPAVIPVAVKGTTCPSCGFENFGENLFYCKKCGALFPKHEPILKSGPADKTPAHRPHDGPIRIIPDGMDELRRRPVTPLVVARQTAVDVPVALRQSPAPAKGEAQVLPHKPQKKAPLKRAGGFKRRVAYGAAGVLILVLVIAVIALVVPGVLNAGAANSTAPGVFEALSLGIQPNQTPVITETIPASTTAKPVITTAKPVITTAKPVTTRTTPVLNQATTVITDTPLTLAAT